jgi:tripartite-type tricarboxylate transporter receptor subunit TctC
MKSTFASLLCAAALFGFAVPQAHAQPDDYPNRNVTFVCPFPAGGGTDLLVRMPSRTSDLCRHREG